MPILHLESLPNRIRTVELLEFVAETGGLDPKRIGQVELDGRRASLEVPDGWEARLVRALDGVEFRGRRVRASVAGGAAAHRQSGDHFDRLARLLDLESKAEARQLVERAKRLAPEDAERTGNTLIDLVIGEAFSGLGGRVIVTLTKGKRQSALPWTRLEVGAPVMLSAGRGSRQVLTRGVICELQERQLQVAVGSLPQEAELHSNWRIDLAQDEVAEKRQRAAMSRAKSASGDRLAELRDVLLQERTPRFTPAPAAPSRTLDAGLNESQRGAVEFALSAVDVALIHGPPGTGKTTALVEFIRQEVARGNKVLACAPSNMAVDNLLERLVAAGELPVRIGHPARVLPQLRNRTLDLLVERDPDVRVAHRLVDEALELRQKADKPLRKSQMGARREMRQEARALLADARRLEQAAVESILDRAKIVCATNTGLDSDLLGQRTFAVAVIDEACQSTEPGCWIPLLRCGKIVLAGDHCQLPPTILSPEAAAEGLGVSLFERVMTESAGLSIGPLHRRLDVQYRMHQSIMDFSSGEFYEGSLLADPSVASHTLQQLPGVADQPLTSVPLEFIDTAGAGFDEEPEPDGESRRNPREAALIVAKAQGLLAAGVPARDIGVITPYAAQVRLLRELLSVQGLEIDSVDGFQGREKEAILISLVRSNSRGEIGFLAQTRRINVALTRARRKLLVLGDSATLGTDPFFHRLLGYFEARGAYRTVWEEDPGIWQ